MIQETKQRNLCKEATVEAVKKEEVVVKENNISFPFMMYHTDYPPSVANSKEDMDAMAKKGWSKDVVTNAGEITLLARIEQKKKELDELNKELEKLKAEQEEEEEEDEIKCPKCGKLMKTADELKTHEKECKTGAPIKK